ncbi:hypothetical protein [Stutzerimonas kirkiae]|uniref:hypothetical protein n=1 Tax=Stutzerimonas kirkiae TaxID=2211392 RepID=UPI001038409D|nr:hypothetical protein [Stutzerimonas kirkiae]TBV14603.1 hypothetical protein DNK01_08570 [Stutzerimonas kirkiae]
MSSLKALAIVSRIPASLLSFAASTLGIRLDTELSSEDRSRMRSYIESHSQFPEDALDRLETANYLLYKELLNQRLEDRIAQTIMATIYSSCHIEIRSPVQPYTANELRKSAPKPSAISSRQAALNQQFQLSRITASTPTTTHLADVLQGSIARTHSAPEVLIRTDLQPSEIELDTTAVAIIGDTLYAACNFKRRTITGNPKLSPKSFDYINFGHFPDVSLALLWAVLRSELADICNDQLSEDQDRVQAIQYCKIIAPTTSPTNAEENAETHAEMQIVNHCQAKSIERNIPLNIGVSRPCCPECTRTLLERNIGFTRSHAIPPKNWRSPDSFTTKVLHTIPI